MRSKQSLIAIATVVQTSYFTPVNTAATGDWYWIDVSAMAKHTGASPLLIHGVAGEEPCVTDVLDGCECNGCRLRTAEQEAIPGMKIKVPAGGQVNLNPPDNHMQYAAAWYSLSALSVAMIVFSRGRAGRVRK